MTKKAYAKINLALKVLNKNGEYHELDMINAKIDLADELTIEEIEENKIIVEMIPNLVSDDDNLVKKVSEYLKDIYNIEKGFKICINKKIPLASGMAGGSADCACAIHLINDFFDLNMSKNEKEKVALYCGTDVVYCLYNSIAHVEGIGDKVTFAPIYFPYSVLVIQPICQLSTKDIFKEVVKYSDPLDLENPNIQELLGNDLQDIVVKNVPRVGLIIDEIKKLDVIHVQTSGAGATILVFIEPHKAHFILSELKNKLPDLEMNIYNIIKNDPQEFMENQEKKEEIPLGIGHSDTPMFIEAEDVQIDFGEEKLRMIHYVYKEDIYDLNDYVIVNRKSSKIGRYILGIIGIIFVIIFAVKLNWVGLIAASLFTIYQLFINIPLRKKTIRKEIDKKMTVDKRKMVIIVTELGLYYAYEYETNVPCIPWNEIREVISTYNYLFVGLTSGGYIPLNKNRCEKSESLTQLFKEYLGDKFIERK